MFFVNADFFILIGNRNFLYQLGHPLHFLCIGYHCLLKNNQLSKKLKSPKQSFGRKFDAKVAKIVDKSPNLTTQKGTWTIFRRHFIPRFSSVVCESKILSCDCRVVTLVIATGNNSFQRILERNRIDPGTCNSCNRFRS